MIRSEVVGRVLLLLAACINPLRVTADCKYDFKVYVYPLPRDLPSVKLAEDARVKQEFHVCNKCIFEQFALEFVVHDFLTQFCGRTLNPDEADFFYLPVIRDVEYRATMGKSRDSSATEKALLSLLTKNDAKLWEETFTVPSQYWKRFNGADHIIVMPAPVTNLRHESMRRGFFHYMIQLYRPIFLNVEFSKSFVEEYPICSTQKDIVMPYPTTDFELFNGAIYQHTNGVVRDRFLFYQGGNHGSCTFIRKKLNELTGLLEVGMKKVKGKYWREIHFKKSFFCPIPVGDSPSSKRMYDVMHLGCIPVVLSDDLIWAYSLESGGVIDSTAFSIRLPQQVIFQSPAAFVEENKDKPMQKLPSGITIMDLALKVLSNESCSGANTIHVPDSMHGNMLVAILRCVPTADILALQRGVELFAPLYRYYSDNATLNSIPTALQIQPNGGAIDIMAQLLSVRKQRGANAIADACDAERNRKGHKYINNYPCVEPSRRLQCDQSNSSSIRLPHSMGMMSPPLDLSSIQLDESIWSFRSCPDKCQPFPSEDLTRRWR